MATITQAIPAIRTSLQRVLQRLCSNPELFRYRNIIVVKFGFISMLVTLAFLITAAWLQMSFRVPAGYTICWIPLATFLLLILSVAFSKISELLFTVRSRSTLRNVSFTYLGGFLGVVGATGILSAAFSVPFLRVCDATVLSWPLFHALSRIACINYGCCHGKPLPGHGRFGLTYYHETSKAVRVSNLRGVPLYPAQVYEMLGCMVLGIIGLLVFRCSGHHGYISAAYCISYGSLRHLLQHYRHETHTDREFFGILSYQQCLTAAFFAMGLGFMAAGAIQKIPIESHFELVRRHELIWIFPSAAVASILVFLGYGVHRNKVGQWF